MSQTDHEAAVAQYLATKGVTRCPTVCAVPTQATIADSDRVLLREYVAAQEAARQSRIKSVRSLINLWPIPTA